MVFEITKSCNLLCVIIIPLVRGDCGGCVAIPLSEEAIVGVVAFEPYPSIVRLILF